MEEEKKKRKKNEEKKLKDEDEGKKENETIHEVIQNRKSIELKLELKFQELNIQTLI